MSGKFLTPSLIVLGLGLWPQSGSASALNVYLAQNSAGTGDGSSCANAKVYSFFNTGSNWGSASTQIGPGTTVHVCGTITLGSGATGFTFQGSGASGNPVTLLFEPSAILQAPYWSGGGSNLGGAVVMNNVSWVTVDGGTNGLIRATLNGTPGGACPGGACSSPAHDGNGVMFQNCTNCTLQNMEVGPIYLRTSLSDESSAATVGCRAVSKEGNCNNCTITQNNLHDASALIEYDLPGGVDNALVVSNNNMHDTSAGIDIAQGTGESGTLASFTFSGNSVHDFASWNDGSGYNFHHDGIHIYTYTTPLSGINVFNNHWYGNLGNGTAWVYYEQYAGGTGAMNVFDNVFSFYATAVNGAGGARAIEVEGNALNVKIYNNTLYGLNQSGTIASGIYMNATSAVPDLRNNIIGGNLEALLEGSRIATTSNNNVYDFAGGSSITIGSGYSSSNFSSWRSFCSCDSASASASPNLNSNYQIQSTSSSAYNLGQNLTGNPTSSINVDMAGVPRPATGNWDAGAYQLGSALSPPGLLSAVSR